MFKGISLNFVLSADGSQVTFPTSDVALLQQANAQIARLDLHLGSRASWDSTIIANYTTVINQLIAGGVQVLGLLSYGIVPSAQQSAWNQGAVEQGGPGTNPFIDQYTSAAAQIVQAFPQVRLWELWNEPNVWYSQPSPGVYTGGSFIYPSLFATLLNQVHTVIKTYKPSDTVITGGLLAQDTQNTNEDSSGANYLQNVYTYGKWTTYTTPFDAVGLHVYLDQGGTLAPQNLMRELLEHFAVDVTNEGRTRWKSVYVTESGWTTAAVSGQTQASNVAALLAQLRSIPYLKAVLNYQLRDSDQHYGLYNGDGSAKPSLSAFQQA